MASSPDWSDAVDRCLMLRMFAGACAAAAAGCSTHSPHLRVPESEVGFHGNTWTTVDAELERAIGAGEVKGAVVCVARNGAVVYERAIGTRTAAGEPMTTETVFDVASLAKPVATASAVGLLMCDGKIADSDPLDTATVADALVHQTDLPQYAAWESLEPFRAEGGSPADAVGRWLAEKRPARHRHDYSNIGFVLLAGEVERRCGTSMEALLRERMWGPLGMDRTTFDPGSLPGATFAATAVDIAPGTPFDPLADWIAKRFPGHTPGHSGMFSTARDLSVFCQTLLNPEDSSVDEMDCISSTLFGNASTIVDPAEAGASVQFSAKSRSRAFNRIDSTRDGPIYWHTGYTGSLLWMNAKTGTSVVMLTNTTLTEADGWDAMRGAVLKIVNKGTVRAHGEELYDPEIYTPDSGDLGVMRIRL